MSAWQIALYLLTHQPPPIQIDDAGSKLCIGRDSCNEIKPLREFYLRFTDAGEPHYSSTCKLCQNKRAYAMKMARKAKAS
jgi:hypothetical protein